MINFVRRGGKLEIDVEVQPPNPSGNGCPTQGAGVPPREGAHDASQDGEQLRQHQAAAGGGGVIPMMAPGMPTAAGQT